ncbi:MAG: signal peptidase II, partial [Chlamydiae bacterium]|nr:signal peptidase II [Chlamydiota bacterium]
AVKAIVHYNIPLMLWSAPIYPYGGVPVFEDILGVDLSINHVTNRGGPWGVVASHHGALVLVRLFAIACLWGHLLFFNQIKFRQIPLVMIIAGAMGNVLDSFLYGHVIDMIHFVFWGYSFPVFNVADALICVGVGSLMLHACIQKWKLKKEKPLSLEEPAIEQSPFDRLGPYGHE